jgi:hypothetical protein
MAPMPVPTETMDTAVPIAGNISSATAQKLPYQNTEESTPNEKPADSLNTKAFRRGIYTAVYSAAAAAAAANSIIANR